MSPTDPEQARRHDAANRDRFANRRALRRMRVELRELERHSQAFDVREQRTKQAIEESWQLEHFGQSPPRPPAWQHAPER